MCSLLALSIENVVVFVPGDLDFAHELATEGYVVYVPEPSIGIDVARFGTVKYQQLMLARTSAVLVLLKLGYNVLLADCDAVWLRNPFSFLDEKVFEVVAQADAPEFLCGGFLYLRATTGSLIVWEEVHSEHRQIVNAAMTTGLSVIASDANEQEALKRSLQRHPSVSRAALDTRDFPNGSQYFEGNRAHVPVVVHNNMIVGKDAKVSRFVSAGLWRISVDNKCTDHTILPSRKKSCP